MTEPRWAISRDGEIYHGDYATRDDALACAEDELGDVAGTRVYVGQRIEWTPSLNGAWIADHLADSTCDDVPAEVVDDWPNLTREQEQSLGDQLTAALHAWLRDNGKWPTFFTVEHAEEHSVPEDA